MPQFYPGPTSPPGSPFAEVFFIKPDFQTKTVKGREYIALIRLEPRLGPNHPALAIDIFKQSLSWQDMGPDELHVVTKFFPITPEGVQHANEILEFYDFPQRIAPIRHR